MAKRMAEAPFFGPIFRDNETTIKITFLEGGGLRLEAESKIVQNDVFFRGKRHDTKICWKCKFDCPEILL